MCVFVRRSVCILLVFAVFVHVECGRVRHQSPATKQAMKFLKGIGVNIHNKQTNAHVGLWPPVLNLATKAVISVNATCGEGGREEFCRLHDAPARNHFAELIGGFSAGGGGGGGGEQFGGHGGRCGVCDNFSRDPHKRHPINYAIDDGSNRWWQSPAIHYGAQYEYVTITLDLKQVYQVVYVKLKAANAPRPGAWMLERSVDGMRFEPWQYFATSDKDCLDRYGLPARKGKPHYFTDSEVICTSFYSKLAPMENGEIYTLLVHGRPGANETSPELLEFTKARYVRFRFQGLRAKVDPLPARIAQDINRSKKLFYSIRDILIGGQCVCNGHASTCRHKLPSGNLECECGHNTCGPNCERCCPLYNQHQWAAGTSRDAQVCHACQCHGHASSCRYDEDVAQAKLSLNAEGQFIGGGVCDNCTKHTMGVNCEKCVPGYYRPLGTAPDADVPCVKCECDAYGSSGECTLVGGSLVCQCRIGYTGVRCDQCESGYRGYPNCERCPCNLRGSRVASSGECEGECECKDNVEGRYCDRCKVGYFSLQASNPEGCSACYCSGVTSVCSSAYLQPQIYPFNINDKWLVTDISVKDIETPLLDEREMLTVGNNEIIGIEAYYWLAPTSYTGNRLSLYGSNLLYSVHWVVMRGDTSGKPTTGPNIILVGGNGMRIACGDDAYTQSNMSFLIPLDEYHELWYHIPDDVDDIITRLRRTEYKGEKVTRTQFMSVLEDLKYILLRAKFHTDQIEASLEEVVIYSGNFTDGYSPVEECSCPSGYTGLSCELCQYGFVRVLGNNSRHEVQGYCVKCDCNGHSETCDGESGQCKCEHNTIGENCERCAAGYYGNPLLGTPADCKKCACPLVEDENNFSPSCQLDASSISNDDVEPGYVCTQCPKGYTGDHCEICDDGYFGVPSKKGGRCEPCSCGGGPCDRLTGQCLSCRGNTEGWKCDRCKDGFYGSPLEGCESCHCDSLGALSPSCDNTTGACSCKPHFIGRTCNKCELGYGNVTAQCVECNCDLIGSTNNQCDQTSGMCECRPGVEGFRCDACQHLHYGFSKDGCASCNCSVRGSELRTCNIVTGQCRCKAHYVGLTCETCRDGYYESSYDGCQPCQCDEIGAESVRCQPQNGRCTCKPGVEGPNCQRCKDGYYGFSKTGCKECEPCTKPGHICDQDTGRCTCPPNSHGENCAHCKPNHWGYEPNVGCKHCNCSETGSIRAQCDLHTALCHCQQGYTGPKCDQCAHGYYGYPKCRRCSCHYPGTDPTLGNCDSTGVCQCSKDGTCPCKANVLGRRCNQCVEGTFGLHLENPEGCTECFCFGRSKTCKEAGFTWSKIRMKNRTFSVDFIDRSYNPQVGPNPQNNLFLDTNNFQEIEGTTGNLSVPHEYFQIPLYWRLPSYFTGDRILSYGGYLRFSIDTQPAPSYHGDFTQYPTARIEGNGLKLIHYGSILLKKFEIRLHEDNWRLEEVHGLQEKMLPITRDILMVALQRVTGIYIKATDYRNFENLTLSDVSLDTGVHLLGSPPPLAMGVEKCTCPPEYNGTSCQNPSLGYHRYPGQPTGYPYRSEENIDQVIGSSKACSCKGRSKICDIETGHCLNCGENTAGPSCERCAEGYYGDPAAGGCEACACPSVTQNFAISCVPNPRANHVVCKCKPGYYGPTCDRCAPGYYGQPTLPGGNCKPCECNPEGSLRQECDPITGSCACKTGIVGQKCSECMKSRHILENNACVLCDDCVQILLDRIDGLKTSLKENTAHLNASTLQPPWGMLEKIESKYLNLSEKVDLYLTGKDTLTEIIDNKEIETLEEDVDGLKDVFGNNRKKALTVKKAIRDNKARSEVVLDNISKTKDELQSLHKSLSDFATGSISTKHALKSGEKLLQEIKKHRNKINKAQIKTDHVQEHCDVILKRFQILVNSSKINDLHELELQVNTISNRTGDFTILLKDLHVKNEIGRLKNLQNKEHLQSLKETYSKAHVSVSKLQELVQNEINQVEMNKQLFNSSLLTDYNDLNQLLDQLDERISDDYVDTLPGKRELLQEHVTKLVQTAEEYRREFQRLDHDLQKLNSTGRFKESSLDLIKISQKTYEEAKNEFDVLQNKFFEPVGNDTLYDKSAINEAAAERLHKRIDPIKTKIENDIKQLQKDLQNGINDLKQNNWDNGLANNNILDQMRKLTTSLKQMKTIEETIRRAVASMAESRQIHKIASDLNITKKYNLEKSYGKFLNLTSAVNINRFKNNIRFTKDLLRNVSNFKGSDTHIDVLNQNRNIIDNFKQKRSTIEEKLAQLKNNIIKAKQIASMISLPLSGLDCGRRYHMQQLEPSTKFSLSMEFTPAISISKEILRLTESGKTLVRLAMADGNLQLSFNDLAKDIRLNGGASDVKLDINETGISVKQGNTKLCCDNANSDMVLTKLYKFDSNDVLELGWNDQYSERGLPGCIKELNINHRPIGLWNYVQTEGQCNSCNWIQTKLTGQNYRFGGDSYVVYQGLKPEGGARISFTITFRTFDENALIFFLYVEEAYIAITLEQGYVHFMKKYNSRVMLQEEVEFKSKMKYNKGSKTILEFSRVYKPSIDTVKFSINNGAETQTFTNQVLGKDLVKIRKGQVYIGGFPPDYKHSEVAAIVTNIERTPFLGKMSADFENMPLLPTEKNYSFYNVLPVDQDSPISYDTVLLDTKPGYVNLSTSIDDSLTSFSFVLRVSNNNNQEQGDILSINNQLVFKLRNGRLLYDNDDEKIESINMINDDLYHLIHIDECFYIDGIKQNSKKCPDIDSILDDDVNVVNITIGGQNSFQGMVKDIEVNSERVYVSPETYVDHFGAKIGRRLPLPKASTALRAVTVNEVNVDEKTNDISMKDMKDMTPSLCERVNYAFEPNAFKFGDSPNSFIALDLKNGFWKGNYTIEFELRTFHDEGLLLLANGNNMYNMFLIHEGNLELRMKGKKMKAIEGKVRVDDGRWHRVVIENHHSMQKKKRRLSLTIDGVRQNKKMPQTKVANKLFIGYIPKDIANLYNSQQFRGCLRALKINHMSPNVFDKKKSRPQIGQCFANIERGSYFRGDAYVTYDRAFRLNNYLDIAFDFRTDQQNGILLSVADVTSRPALSIELQNGAVVMSVDMGNGFVTNVTNNLAARNSACNNEWHKVVASFTTELSVHVDDVRQTWVLNGVEGMRSIAAPLYIGGLPDTAPGGTLKIRENFKGCIRNLSINNKQIEWINMHELMNVSLNSCPVNV